MSSTKRISLHVDRIEGDIAVLEWEDIFIDMPLSILPDDLKEGMLISLETSVASSSMEEAKGRLDRLKAKFKKRNKIDL